MATTGRFPRPRTPRPAAPPPTSAERLRTGVASIGPRVRAAAQQPLLLSALLVLLLIVGLLAKGPLTRTIGTADNAAPAPVVGISAAAEPVGASAAPSAPAHAARLHAPRNPFGPLVDAAGASVAPSHWTSPGATIGAATGAHAAGTSPGATASGGNPRGSVGGTPPSRAGPGRSSQGASSHTAAPPGSSTTRGSTGGCTAAYVVRSGDSLWSIAAARVAPDAGPGAVTQAWRAVFHANRAVIGSDPGHILPGQTLCLAALGAG